MNRRMVGVSLVLLILGTGFLFAQHAEDASTARMKTDIFFLASPECEGRGPGTKGIDKAANHIAKQFADAGLVPGGKDGYFQPFEISGSSVLEKPNTLAFNGPLGQSIEFSVGKDFNVMGVSGKGEVAAPLVFVGYGLQHKKLDYDEYKGVNVAGKIVVILRHVPRWGGAEPFGGAEKDQLAGLDRKVAVAESLKAAGVLVVNDSPELPAGDQLTTFAYLTQATPSRIPCLHVKRSALDPVFQNSLGMTLREVEQAINRDLKPRSGELTGWSAKLRTSVRRETIPVKNVIGVLEGSGPLAKEIIVVGSHYDHLGYGGSGSLAKEKGVKTIHFGADDNGSGTTAMIELSRRFASMKGREGRKIVFMAFSAEERGLLGSAHFCNKEPLVPLADVAVMVNLDMVGRLRPDLKTKKEKLIVQGASTSKNFGALVDKLNAPGFQFTKTPGGFGPSDHASFYAKKIPVLFFWTGDHEDYHRPTDTPERINLVGMKKIVDFVETVIANLASDPQRPDFIETKAPAVAAGPPGPRLGIVPDYSSADPGVAISGVKEGGPADKAGIKAGDRIVEIAGRNVGTIETYMVIMADQRVGQPLELTLIRDGKKQTVKVTP